MSTTSKHMNNKTETIRSLIGHMSATEKQKGRAEYLYSNRNTNEIIVINTIMIKSCSRLSFRQLHSFNSVQHMHLSCTFRDQNVRVVSVSFLFYFFINTFSVLFFIYPDECAVLTRSLFAE